MNSFIANQTHKTSVNLSLGLCENASVIPFTFLTGDGINCKIANALIFALLRTDNQISSNDDMLQLGMPDFYSRNKSIAAIMQYHSLGMVIYKMGILHYGDQYNSL